MATIVTTIRFNPENTVPVFTFIAYHLAIGFSHVYLFIDHESNFSLQNELNNRFDSDFLTIFKRSDELSSKQREACLTYRDLEPYLESEVPARQTVNAEYAYYLASSQGFSWLLHIDIDELFYLSRESVEDHFAYLDSINAKSMTYVNHEGVPEVLDTADYFASVSLFRRHHFSIPINNVTSQAIEFWKQRTTYNQYFLVYDNGKSAVRLGIPGTVPRDVHRWIIPPIDNINEDIIYRTNLMDPRHLQVKRILKRDEPCILHFVTCGLRWLMDKYNILGRFPNYWFGDKLPIAPSFHLTARDIVLAENNNIMDNKINTIKFYLSQIMLNCSNETMNDIVEYLNGYSEQVVDDSMLENLKSLVDNNYAELRDMQLKDGVLFRLNSIQSIMNVVHGDYESINLANISELRGKVNEIRLASTSAIVNNIHSADAPASVINLFTEDGKVSEMDRLRIISQVAMNFL